MQSRTRTCDPYVMFTFGITVVLVPALCFVVSRFASGSVVTDNSLSHCAVFSLLVYTVNTSPSVSTSCSKLAPRGTLTLGAAHILNNNKIQINPFTSPLKKLSMFRLWGRERSKQEVTSLNCTEGDLVKWEVDNWDTQICAPLSDSNLRCGEKVILYINLTRFFNLQVLHVSS